MLALYRSGRQTEALESHRVHRQALVRELGLEPGRPLQQLEQQILRQDPTLDPPEAALGTRQHRRRLTLVAGAAVGLAAAVFVVGGNAGASATAVLANSVAAIDPHTNRVVADVQVGGGPSWIAAGAGSVWVLNERDQTISQIDARQRGLVRTFSIGAIPAAIGVVDGALWVAGAGRSGSLLRLDPQGVVVEQIPMTDRNVARLARRTQLEIGGSVWLSSNLDNDLARVNPITGTHTLVSVGSSATIINGVAVGGGSVWVTDRGSNQLWQIDPITPTRSGPSPSGRPPLESRTATDQSGSPTPPTAPLAASTHSKAKQPQQSASAKPPQANSRSRTG
jgi:YVTN family beta-propeller protein